MEPTHPFYFLSSCFDYPDKDTPVANLSDALVLLAGDMGLQLESDRKQVPELETLQAEYVRLFINSPGGVAAPPYASVYVNHSGIMRQKGYDEAMFFYNKAGFEPVESGESPDHIMHELNFLGLLLDRDDMSLTSDFLNSHLCKWYPRFEQRIVIAEPLPFFQILAQVTHLCLKQTLKEVMHEQATFS